MTHLAFGGHEGCSFNLSFGITNCVLCFIRCLLLLKYKRHVTSPKSTHVLLVASIFNETKHASADLAWREGSNFALYLYVKRSHYNLLSSPRITCNTFLFLPRLIQRIIDINDRRSVVHSLDWTFLIESWKQQIIMQIDNHNVYIKLSCPVATTLKTIFVRRYVYEVSNKYNFEPVYLKGLYS